MLPRWTDAAQLHIAPEQCAMVIRHRGLRAQSLLRRRAYAADGEALLAAVRAELGTLPPRTPVRVTLSNHLVRFALVPFNARIVGAAPLAAVARQAFRHVHGAVVDQWDVTVSAAGECTRIAAAIDQMLRQGLIDAASSAGVNLSAIDPLLMEGYNAARGHLFATGWFAVAEPGRIALARIADGDWSRVVSVRCDDDWRGAIYRLVAREAAWTEGDAERYCQVADYTGDSDGAAVCPQMRVVSLAPNRLAEAA